MSLDNQHFNPISSMPSLSLSIRCQPSDVELNPESLTYAKQLETVEKWKAIWSKFKILPQYSPGLYSQPGKHKPLIVNLDKFEKCEHVANSIRYSEEIDNSYIQRYWYRWSEQKPVRTKFTHFHEDARRLISAYETGLPVTIHDEQGRTIGHLNTEIEDTQYIINSHKNSRLGSFIERFPIWLGSSQSRPTTRNIIPGSSAEKIADSYWKLPVFIHYANRFIASCATPALPHALLVMKRHGHNKAFVKAIQTKRGFWTVDIRNVYTLQDAHMKVAEVIGEEWVLPPHGSGSTFSNSTFMIQPFVEMKNECRVFVVNGKVVAGVPVRRADSVYDAQGDGIFDIRKCIGHDNHPAVIDKELMKRYEEFAHQVASECSLTEYVMDIAEDQFGKPFLIEFNELSRAGLYSCDPERIMWPLIEAQLERIVNTIEIDKAYTNVKDNPDGLDFFKSALFQGQDTKTKVKNLIFALMAQEKAILENLKPSPNVEMKPRSFTSPVYSMSCDKWDNDKETSYSKESQTLMEVLERLELPHISEEREASTKLTLDLED